MTYTLVNTDGFVTFLRTKGLEGTSSFQYVDDAKNEKTLAMTAQHTNGGTWYVCPGNAVENVWINIYMKDGKLVYCFGETPASKELAKVIETFIKKGI